MGQTLPIRAKPDSVEPDASSHGVQQADFAEMGKRLGKEQFLFDPSYRNLNHGSFGTIPRAVQQKLREYQDRAEAAPDKFIRYEQPHLIDESRAAIAQLLRVPTDTVVFVSNATTGVNTVLRNLVWADDGLDEILYFDTIYGACAKTIDYMVEISHAKVAGRQITLSYPCEDADVLEAFRAAVAAVRAEGKRPRVCIFDVVSSQPGVRFPFEAMTAACRELDILSLVDGAQGVGMVHLDLGALDPDFFVSNCHKWLHVPRGCAVFHVPHRNQALIRSSLPTSHGFVPRSGGARLNPLPQNLKGPFVSNFEFVGTLDNAPYLCVKDAIQWRAEVLGGEERIVAALQTLAREGGRKVAELLGTEILDNKEGTLTRCAMVNVALPLVVSSEGDGKGPDSLPAGLSPLAAADAAVATQWMQRKLVEEYKTFIAMVVYRGRWWARLSAQVYLEMEDFEWAGHTLKEICARAAKGEYKEN